ncbi:uncharacterized protein Z518_00632 [Rhinocladiella mackenziei CBS 650.93]|uniref:SnoaL-like domain-containing protein n=1 Tax=Rhinocladiella mackenziei CBS 650.93 TaxID=1442369 RepID=A0A0D2G4F8_9EURO|nr:uncharacterized protein Z518_00632 [Rhinocladiella mackenziei CBS 650.93]KIX09552.1 hypothetical protein Z518_00632 [Rhinocladiella mackenziei CBS 650.93]
MEQQYSKLLETAQAVIKGYEKWDIDAIMAPRTPDCTYHTLPKSLNRPVMNNEAFRAHYTGVIPYLRNFRVAISDTVIDIKTNQVAFHTTSTAETVIGPYESEQTIFLKMTEDGTKICEMKEFLDSALVQGLFADLAKYIENGGKPIGEAK